MEPVKLKPADLIKLLSLNGIFPIQKQYLINTQNLFLFKYKNVALLNLQ